MTRAEAIKAMREGKKVTHRYFTPEEWATQEKGEILLEDGVRCSPAEFWRDRTTQWFDDGWELFKEVPQKTDGNKTQPARANMFHTDGDGGEFDDFGVPGIF
jgi:hypothetical protein